MEQLLKEITGGLISLPFLPMTILFFVEVIFGVTNLREIRRPAISLLLIASIRIISIIGLFLVELTSKTFQLSGGDPGLEGAFIVLLLFSLWIILSLISLITISFILVYKFRLRNKEVQIGYIET